MSRHHTEDIEALTDTMAATFAEKVGGDVAETERYRPRVTRLRVLTEVQLVTRHTIRAVGETINDEVLSIVETERDRPSYVLGKRWADWKAKRMKAAAYRRDVREQQPWAVQR